MERKKKDANIKLNNILDENFTDYTEGAYRDLYGRNKDLREFYKKIQRATNYKNNKTILNLSEDTIHSLYVEPGVAIRGEKVH